MGIPRSQRRMPRPIERLLNTGQKLCAFRIVAAAGRSDLVAPGVCFPGPSHYLSTGRPTGAWVARPAPPMIEPCHASGLSPERAVRPPCVGWCLHFHGVRVQVQPSLRVAKDHAICATLAFPIATATKNSRWGLRRRSQHGLGACDAPISRSQSSKPWASQCSLKHEQPQRLTCALAVEEPHAALDGPEPGEDIAYRGSTREEAGWAVCASTRHGRGGAQWGQMCAKGWRVAVLAGPDRSAGRSALPRRRGYSLSVALRRR